MIPDGASTVKFKSDPMQNARGWAAVYHDGSMGIDEKLVANENSLLVYPNPADNYVNIVIPAEGHKKVFVNDITGKVIFNQETGITEPAMKLIQFNISDWPRGIYSIVMSNNSGHFMSSRIIKLNY